MAGRKGNGTTTSGGEGPSCSSPDREPHQGYPEPARAGYPRHLLPAPAAWTGCALLAKTELQGRAPRQLSQRARTTGVTLAWPVSCFLACPSPPAAEHRAGLLYRQYLRLPGRSAHAAFLEGCVAGVMQTTPRKERRVLVPAAARHSWTFGPPAWLFGVPRP